MGVNESFSESELTLLQVRKVIGYRSQASFIEAIYSKLSDETSELITLNQPRWSRIESFREIPLLWEAKAINEAIEKLLKDNNVKTKKNWVTAIPLARDQFDRVVNLRTGEIIS